MDSTEMDEVGGIIAAFEAQVGQRHRPIALIGRFRVRAGAGPRIEKEFAKASAQTASEVGVLAYQLHREPNDPDVFVVYERWRCLDDLEAHLYALHRGAAHRDRCGDGGTTRIPGYPSDSHLIWSDAAGANLAVMSAWPLAKLNRERTRNCH